MPGRNRFVKSSITWDSGKKFLSMLGKNMSDDAKMMGMTPAMITRSGNTVFWPAYIFVPTTFFGVWMGMRRVAWVKSTINAVMRKTIASTMSSRNRFLVPAITCWISLNTAVGILSTMPMKMMNEMPLPIPLLVICSPSHMIKTVPVVRLTAVTKVNMGPAIAGITACWPVVGDTMLWRNTLTPMACTKERSTVP